MNEIKTKNKNGFLQDGKGDKSLMRLGFFAIVGVFVFYSLWTIYKTDSLPSELTAIIPVIVVIISKAVSKYFEVKGEKSE